MSAGAALYLLKEAGALLAGASIAGAFSGGAASPPFMPTLPWRYNYRNIPGPIPIPPMMTRIPAGTQAPPSAYSEAGLLNTETGLAGWSEAGSAPPSGSGISQAQWDALPAASQTAVYNEMASRARTAPQSTAVRMTTSNQAPAPAPCPPGYVNLGGGEFANNCVPAHTITMTRMTTSLPALPPAIELPPSVPPNVAPPPPELLPPSSGGGGGGGAIPWGPIAAGGVVLAFLYAGRRKQGRRRR